MPSRCASLNSVAGIDCSGLLGNKTWRLPKEKAPNLIARGLSKVEPLNRS